LLSPRLCFNLTMPKGFAANTTPTPTIMTSLIDTKSKIFKMCALYAGGVVLLVLFFTSRHLYLTGLVFGFLGGLLSLVGMGYWQQKRPDSRAKKWFSNLLAIVLMLGPLMGVTIGLLYPYTRHTHLPLPTVHYHLSPVFYISGMTVWWAFCAVWVQWHQPKYRVLASISLLIMVVFLVWVRLKPMP